MEPTASFAELAYFQDLNSRTRDSLGSAARVVSCSRGRMIYRAKEPIKKICFQLQGKSILYNVTHNGSRKIIFVLGPGELLNDHVLNIHESSLFCEAIEKSLVLEIPSRIFLEEMEKDFSLTKKVIAAQERKIWRMGHQLKNTRGNIYLEKKLAAKLWKLARDFGRKTEDGFEIDFNISVTFLADLLGVPRETASRSCRALTERRLISMDRKRITILDPNRIACFYKADPMQESSVHDRVL